MVQLCSFYSRWHCKAWNCDWPLSEPNSPYLFQHHPSPRAGQPAGGGSRRDLGGRNWAVVLGLGSSPNAARALLGWSLGQRESQYRSPKEAEPPALWGLSAMAGAGNLPGIATAKRAEWPQLTALPLISAARGSPNRGRARLTCSLPGVTRCGDHRESPTGVRETLRAAHLPPCNKGVPDRQLSNLFLNPSSIASPISLILTLIFTFR